MSSPDSVAIMVGGMHCRNCVNSVTKKLSAMPGVTKVDVALDKGEAVVTGNNLDRRALMDAIEELGFDAALPA